jgi:hypothetical protein
MYHVIASEALLAFVVFAHTHTLDALLCLVLRRICHFEITTSDHSWRRYIYRRKR